jgi:hypothetical protein
VQLPQLAAESDQLPEDGHISGVGRAREINFQKFFVFPAVCGGMEYGVNVIKNIYRRKCAFFPLLGSATVFPLLGGVRGLQVWVFLLDREMTGEESVEEE